MTLIRPGQVSPGSDGQFLKTVSGEAAWVDDASASAEAAEFIRDTVAATLVGSGDVTVTVDDSGDTITISVSGSSYTDEQVRDVIGAALTAGAAITLTVNDAGDTITVGIADGAITRAKAAADLRSQIPTARSFSGTTDTLILADAGGVVVSTGAVATVVTIPTNASVAVPVDTVLEIEQYGAGQVTVTPDTGVTLRSPGGAKTRVQYSSLRLRQRAVDEWAASGDTTT